MLRDLRYAVRSVYRWRLGTVMAVATLAIGTGTASSLYVFLRAALTGVSPRISKMSTGQPGSTHRATPLASSADLSHAR